MPPSVFPHVIALGRRWKGQLRTRQQHAANYSPVLVCSVYLKTLLDFNYECAWSDRVCFHLFRMQSADRYIFGEPAAPISGAYGIGYETKVVFGAEVLSKDQARELARRLK
jgi:hypothetical protein